MEEFSAEMNDMLSTLTELIMWYGRNASEKVGECSSPLYLFQLPAANLGLKILNGKLK